MRTDSRVCSVAAAWKFCERCEGVRREVCAADYGECVSDARRDGTRRSANRIYCVDPSTSRHWRCAADPLRRSAAAELLAHTMGTRAQCVAASATPGGAAARESIRGIARTLAGRLAAVRRRRARTGASCAPGRRRSDLRAQGAEVARRGQKGLRGARRRRRPGHIRKVGADQLPESRPQDRPLGRLLGVYSTRSGRGRG